MHKKSTIATAGIASLIILLSGCGGPKEEYSKGIALLEKGDYASLVKAKEFFEAYSEKNPDDKGVSEYSKQVDDAILNKSKELANTYYNSKDLYKAIKYAKIAKSLAPNDKNVTDAYKTVNAAYKQQVKYDEFARYLEEQYIETKNLVDTWDADVKKLQSGDPSNIAGLKTLANSLFPKATEIRKTASDETFNITGSTGDTFKDTNSKLFEYIYSVESELTFVINNRNSENISDLLSTVRTITPEQFTTTFLNIQNSMNSYVTEKDFDGNEKRHIKDTLNFTKAYKAFKQEELKKSEEAQAQLTTPATPATPQSTTSTSSN